MSVILAIDQSTSATKALLFSKTGNLLDKTVVPHTQIYPQPGWVEHDAAEIYRHTLQAVTTLLARNKDQQDSLMCLSLTNQRETIVVFDEATGEPLYNAIVWQCHGAKRFVRNWKRRGMAPWFKPKPASRLTPISRHPN